MVCKNATRSASSTDVEMGAKETTFFSEVKEKPIQSFINSSKSASMDELQQMSSNKANTPSAVWVLHQQLFKSSHCDMNNIMQVNMTARSRGKELTYLMCNHDGQIDWFLTHKSLNFRALSTPSRAGGFFSFLYPFSRLAVLSNSHTSTVNNTWKAASLSHLQREAVASLEQVFQNLPFCISGGLVAVWGRLFLRYHHWILSVWPSAHSSDI